MSRKAAPVWIARHGCDRYGLSGIERAVLLCLWDHATYERLATVSQPTVAKETGFSVRSVAYAFAALERRQFTSRYGVVDYGPGVNGRSREVVTWTLTASPRMVKPD